MQQALANHQAAVAAAQHQLAVQQAQGHYVGYGYGLGHMMVSSTAQMWPTHLAAPSPIQRSYTADLPAVDSMPDTFGWRGWYFDGTVLVSPSYQTKWNDAELRVAHWDESDVVRGVAGIHALLAPKNWMTCDPGHTEIGPQPVHGIVERFGRFVLGTMGWRAEWVIIRELATHDKEIGLKLKQAYPDAKIHWVRLRSEEL